MRHIDSAQAMGIDLTGRLRLRRQRMERRTKGDGGGGVGEAGGRRRKPEGIPHGVARYDAMTEAEARREQENNRGGLSPMAGGPMDSTHMAGIEPAPHGVAC